MFDFVHGGFKLHRTHVVVTLGLAATSRWFGVGRTHIVVRRRDYPWLVWLPLECIPIVQILSPLRARVVESCQLLKFRGELLIFALLETNQFLKSSDFDR